MKHGVIGAPKKAVKIQPDRVAIRHGSNDLAAPIAASVFEEAFGVSATAQVSESAEQQSYSLEAIEAWLGSKDSRCSLSSSSPDPRLFARSTLIMKANWRQTTCQEHADYSSNVSRVHHQRMAHGSDARKGAAVSEVTEFWS